MSRLQRGGGASLGCHLCKWAASLGYHLQNRGLRWDVTFKIGLCSDVAIELRWYVAIVF
jgi:hypothetical protein